MKSQPAEVIAALLVKRSVAIRPDGGERSQWQVFKNLSPSKPDNVIVCYNEEPELQGRTHRDGKRLVKPLVLIRVRSDSSDTAWEKIQQMLGVFEAIKDRTTRVTLKCLIENEDKKEDVLLKVVTLVEGPRPWLLAEESSRCVTFTFTVQVNASEI